jgi:hypothetical protein
MSLLHLNIAKLIHRLLTDSDSETVKNYLTQIERELERQANSASEQQIVRGKVSRKRRRQYHESDTEEVNNSLESVFVVLPSPFLMSANQCQKD